MNCKQHVCVSQDTQRYLLAIGIIFFFSFFPKKQVLQETMNLLSLFDLENSDNGTTKLVSFAGMSSNFSCKKNPVELLSLAVVTFFLLKAWVSPNCAAWRVYVCSQTTKHPGVKGRSTEVGRLRLFTRSASPTWTLGHAQHVGMTWLQDANWSLSFISNG